MTIYDDPNTHFTEADKITHEVRKLGAEIRVLQHPFRQPTVLIGGIALILSIAGNISQALSYDNQAIIAKAEMAQAKLDRFEMENKRDQAKNDLENLQKQLASIKQQIADAKNSSNQEQAQKKLDNAQRAVADLQQKTQITRKLWMIPNPTKPGNTELPETRKAKAFRI